MNKIVIKILVSVILCCFTCAFLELDFGGRCEQTWHDEYDSYTISSKIYYPDYHSFSFVYLCAPFLPIHDKLIITKVQAAVNTTVNSWFGLKDNKVFIKHRALLI